MRFQCTLCKKPYEDKRFIWEKSGGSASQEAGSESSAPSTEPQPREEPARTSPRPSPRPGIEKVLQTARSPDVRVVSDSIRAAGTCANVAGSLAPAAIGLSVALGPVSALAGCVGTVQGFVQLHEGLACGSRQSQSSGSEPSSQTAEGTEVSAENSEENSRAGQHEKRPRRASADPHLVAKGGVTAVVGTTCMVLGGLGIVNPAFFVAALTVGVTGLAAATAIDAAVPGLCRECKEGGTVTDAEAACVPPPPPPPKEISGRRRQKGKGDRESSRRQKKKKQVSVPWPVPADRPSAEFEVEIQPDEFVYRQEEEEEDMYPKGLQQPSHGGVFSRDSRQSSAVSSLSSSSRTVKRHNPPSSVNAEGPRDTKDSVRFGTAESTVSTQSSPLQFPFPPTPAASAPVSSSDTEGLSRLAQTQPAELPPLKSSGRSGSTLTGTAGGGSFSSLSSFGD
uniref:Uncharacterized protein n=1 Tax=Chromera velia CCMP2878 TaxID=1169474 RepID=A0A0G4HV66_9ALVE|mmetsp:Transcript_55316/g.108259  ORF Transcript_55316/g.108259 Transcript_55316/m.108259 type:complete len:451 (-) Transcript_55316:2186-3538(-)|eukprot:Cvel_8791.t1-p1 / transcript=Cvel_8791.t1 / gene=Cvel_8791 / organism=Chromera_velia_CCMP2878 / gene_product=hypothetical protein / transcript_product=hypothetical protein / location=Cvel_scaffold492:37514-40071(-) / protein_length=450 / sequence_SO=supercontig / SO=protein_coding / is_pseudo=false